MTNLNWRLVAGQETYAAFSFNFLVKKGVITTFNSNGPYNFKRGSTELAKQVQNSQQLIDDLVKGKYIPENIPEGDAGETAQAESPTDETGATGPPASDTASPSTPSEDPVDGSTSQQFNENPMDISYLGPEDEFPMGYLDYQDEYPMGYLGVQDEYSPEDLIPLGYLSPEDEFPAG